VVVLTFGLSGVAAMAADDDGAVKTADYVDDPAADGSAVVQASYSTGASGNKLTWRPYRPSANKVTAPKPIERAAQPASYDEPAQGASVDPNSPLNDPFGDRAQLTQLVPPANLRDDVLEKPDPKPSQLGKLSAAANQQLAPKVESSEQSQPVPLQELEKALASGPQAGGFKCPSPKDPEVIKPINRVGYQITPERGELPQECPLGEEQFRPRMWQPITFTWKASGLCHKPLYFEETQLERYGHTTKFGLQPVVSAAHFFLTVPILPYEMGLYPPNECIYSLGYYRPGSCAPYILDPLPISIRAALFQAAAITTGIVVIP
jgi:hypothetical protein